MVRLKKNFPAGLRLSASFIILPNTWQCVDRRGVQDSCLSPSALVVLVVLIFLQSWRAALIPIIAIPVSLIGSFAVMAAFKFSLNNLSLFGLVLAIGIVVDDAIVVVENVDRHLREGP